MKLVPILMLFLLIPFTYSLEYYLDEEITVKDNGDAEIKGTTNVDFLEEIHPINDKIEGTTPELTKKEGKYWLFLYDSKENLSASFIKIALHPLA